MNDDLSFRIAELFLEGHKCSHILMRLALEAQGRESPDLERAMSGLALGMGQGFNCGALTGAACVIGLCGGRSLADAGERDGFGPALEELTGWFHAMAHEKFGGIDCAEIMKFDPALKAQRCPALVLETWRKIEEILAKHGLDVAEEPR